MSIISASLAVPNWECVLHGNLNMLHHMAFSAHITPCYVAVA